jgi:hypothetical protein
MPRFADRRFVATDEADTKKPVKALVEQVVAAVHKAEEVVELLQDRAEEIVPKVADILETVEDAVEDVVDIVKASPAPTQAAPVNNRFNKHQKGKKR